MAISLPVTKTIISTTGWGIPMTDAVNLLMADHDSLNIKKLAFKAFKQPSMISGAGTGLRDVYTCTIAGLDKAYTQLVIATLGAGGDSTSIYFGWDIQRLSDAAVYSNQMSHATQGASQWLASTHIESMSFGANVVGSFKFRMSLNSIGGGAPYTSVSAFVVQYY